jgi:8-oxo-dGTP pyrophosphatase MutT (NUDIX family)
LPPGGHIELDEDPAQTAVREAKEEVGLDIVLLGQTQQFQGVSGHNAILPPRFMDRHRINENHEHVVMYYFATADTDAVVAGGDDRSEEWKWFTIEELADPTCGVRADIRFYATEARKAAIIEK